MPPSTASSPQQRKRWPAATPPTTPAIAERIFAGEPGAHRDLVLLNAGIRIWLAERAPDIAPGDRRLAREAIDTGKAAALLDAARRP